VNDIDELKQYVVAHVRSQSMPVEYYEELLGRIHTDEDGSRGSWVREWCDAGERLERDGKLLEACQHFTMARFPYVDGPARQEAMDRCVAAFDRWRQQLPSIERLDVDTPGGRVRCWTSGLSATDRLPLLLFTGGIVSIKEQWAPVLTQTARLGMAGLVTEMPGVGENTRPYDRQSWRQLSDLLDAVADRADVTRTYALSLSFSGHMAVRCALWDSRIAGITGAGMPVHDFFVDPDWQRGVPRITVDTLAHLRRVQPADVFAGLRDWALTDDDLSAVDVPVCYVASKRDEIIPRSDTLRLKRNVRRLRMIEHNDVHGSPSHFAETRLWSLLSLLRMRGVHNRQRASISYALLKQRLRRRLIRTQA
jgi:esterase FrsA